MNDRSYNPKGLVSFNVSFYSNNNETAEKLLSEFISIFIFILGDIFSLNVVHIAWNKNRKSQEATKTCLVKY